MNVKRIDFLVKGAPVPKARPRRGRYGNFYTPEATRRYENEIRWAFIDKYAGMEPWSGSVALLVKAYVKAPTNKPDGSNILKTVEDALNGLAYRDDSQIVDARVVKVRSGLRTPWIAVHAEERKP